VPRILGRAEKSFESVAVCPGRGPGGDAAGMYAFLGNDGYIVLVSGRTKQWAGNLKMNGSVRAAAFTRSALGGGDGDYSELLTVGGHGEVYRWDLRTMRCMGRHADEGSTGGTAIAASPDGKRYAVGSTMGVVNVYDAAAVGCSGSGSSAGSAAGSVLDAFGVAASAGASAAGGAGGVAALFSASSSPKPLHTILNLTTGIDTLAWNHDGSLLATGSARVKDAVKLVHAASGTVFANWPTSRTPLHYATALAFSPHSGFMAVGNDRGRVLLYRLNHYGAV
jgi:U3 small nucleolar RNA-associated protein 18